MNRQPKGKKSLGKVIHAASDLDEIAELKAVRDLLLQTVEENSGRTVFAKACRGSFDRAALKCLIASQREVLTALEALVRGSET